jgi:ABC-type transport system involved in cytochrome bd biosynthesis fused ATPase/permease subunit
VRPVAEILRSWLPPILGLALVGAVLLAVAGGHDLLLGLGLILLGSAGVLIVSAMFYEVGRSEDRERERGGQP